MTPVVIAHLLLSYKEVFPARFSNQTHKKFSIVIIEITPSLLWFLRHKRKARWTSSSKEKETKATSDLCNSFHFLFSSVWPSITHPNKDTQLKHLDPWHRSHSYPTTVPAWGCPSQPKPKGTARLTGALPSPRHSSAPAWLCTGWSFPCPISSACGNQSQSSRIHLLGLFFICMRSGSCTPVYGVIKLDFIWICRDSHLFPHSLFALIAALTRIFSSIYQFKQNFKHCLNVPKCIQKCNEVPLPPTACVYCP